MADVTVKLTLDAASLQTALEQVKGKLRDVGATKIDIDTSAAQGKITSLRDSMAMWGLAIQGAVTAIRQAGNAVNSLIRPAAEAEAAQAGLVASLRQTGIYTAQLAQSVFASSSELQKLTKYEDDAITSATGLMQAIGGLSAEQLPAAQKAAIGLAAAFRMDLQTAFQLVGKAAAGNTSLLSRYGIVLGENLDQQEKFAAVLELGAEKFSLAEAEAKTSLGAIEQFKNTWGDMMETIGDLLLPLISDLLKGLKPIVEWFGSLNGVTKASLVLTPLATAAWYAFATSNAAAALASGGLTAAITAASMAVKGFLVSLGPVGWAIMAVGAAMTAYGLATSEAQEATDSMGDSLTSAEAKVRGEEASFTRLSARLLELRKETNHTSASKNEMAGIIHELNSKYGQYLGKINLATASYGELEKAIDAATTAIVRQKNAEAYGEVYSQAVQAYEKANQLAKQAPSSFEAVYGVMAAYRDMMRAESEYRSKLAETYIVGDKETKTMGGGSGTAKPAAPAQSEYDKIIADLQNYLNSETERLVAEYEARKAVILAEIESGTGDVMALQQLGEWRAAEQTKIDATVAEQQTRALDDQESRQAAYYDAVKFADSRYYAWKLEQIDTDVKAQGLAADEAARLTEIRVRALDEEKAAYDRLPLDALLDQYHTLKQSQQTAGSAGSEMWSKIRQGLVDLKAEIESFKGVEGVSDVLSQIQAEIDQAGANAQAKPKSWFWSMLGFDPDSDTDKEKISAFKSTFSDLRSSISSVLTGIVEINSQRRDDEIAQIEAVAAREKWSDDELLRRKQSITSKYEKEEKKLKNIQRAISIAQAVINTAEGATKALTLGPILGPIMAAMISAMGAVQIGIIKAQKFSAGGLFRGAGGPQEDRNMIYVSDGEYIVNAAATRRYRGVLDAMNFGIAQSRVTPQFAFAGGGMVSGGSLALADIASKIDAVNMNLAALELRVNVTNNAPDVETVVEKQELTKARAERRNKSFSYGV